MKSAFRKSFGRDLDQLKQHRATLRRVRSAIDQVEAAENLQEVPNLRKLSGSENYHRIRVGDYRIGIVIENGVVTFVRCLHRRDIYKYFP